MEGSSYTAWMNTLGTCREVEQVEGLDIRAVAGELFAVSELVAREAKLRRALADPARDAWPKQDLARKVFEGKVSEQALQLILSAVGGRWVEDHDLTDAFERIGINMVFAAAEHEGRLNKLQDELFAIEELVVADQGINEALGRRGVPAEPKVALINQLLEGKVSGDALWLAQRPAINPRGRRFAATLWRMLAIADLRRRQVTAVVTSAIELSQEQKHRIEKALSNLYGREVNVNLAVDPRVLGGVEIRVGNDFIDGTIRRRLDDAHRSLTRV